MDLRSSSKSPDRKRNADTIRFTGRHGGADDYALDSRVTPSGAMHRQTALNITNPKARTRVYTAGFTSSSAAESSAGVDPSTNLRGGSRGMRTTSPYKTSFNKTSQHPYRNQQQSSLATRVASRWTRSSRAHTTPALSRGRLVCRRQCAERYAIRTKWYVFGCPFFLSAAVRTCGRVGWVGVGMRTFRSAFLAGVFHVAERGEGFLGAQVKSKSAERHGAHGLRQKGVGRQQTAPDASAFYAEPKSSRLLGLSSDTSGDYSVALKRDALRAADDHSRIDALITFCESVRVPVQGVQNRLQSRLANVRRALHF